MFISAAGVAAAPLLTRLPDLVPVAVATEMPKPAVDHGNIKCRGCQLCTIFYSNCLALNDRVCWRDASPAETA